VRGAFLQRSLHRAFGLNDSSQVLTHGSSSVPPRVSPASSHEPSGLGHPANLADVIRENRALIDGSCKLPTIDACHQVVRSGLKTETLRRPAPLGLLLCRSSKDGASHAERLVRLRAANALRNSLAPENANDDPTRRVDVRLPGTGDSHTHVRARTVPLPLVMKWSRAVPVPPYGES